VEEAYHPPRTVMPEKGGKCFVNFCYPTTIEVRLYVIIFSYKFEVCIRLMMVLVMQNKCHSDKICVLVKFLMFRVK
jgi:hypothetical protein